MAHAVTSPPMLRLRRSAQSGQKLMTAAYVVIYQESSSQAFFFSGARIDLANMQAGDVVDIQILAQLSDGGGYAVLDTIQYVGARPVSRTVASIGYAANVYGFQVQMRQTAGVLRTLACEFYEAKRIGLA